MSDAPTDSKSDIAIEVEGLSKSFGGREVVHDLSMQVRRGSIYDPERDGPRVQCSNYTHPVSANSGVVQAGGQQSTIVDPM